MSVQKPALSKFCLNCGVEVSGKYCPECGQKTSTQRITFSKFIEHDLVHGVFHVDKGILHTVKSIVFRAGYSAKSYLAGKRVKHYSIFALFVILIAIKVFLDDKQGLDLVFKSKNNPESDVKANELLDNYYKLLYLLCIPVMALMTYLFFRRLRYNYIEHIVANCFMVTGCFVYGLAFSVTGLFVNSNSLVGIDLVFSSYVVLLVFYVIYLYQFTRPTYRFLAFTWRVALLLIIYLFTFLLGFATIIVGYYGSFDGTFSFEKFQNGI